MIVFQKFIKREDLSNNPDTLYVFGDNFRREGFGGQAREMRGEPNAIGLVTKNRPDYKEGCYLIDDLIEHVKRSNAHSIARLVGHLYSGGTVVWPEDGIGTGLAKLKENAPKIFQMYEDFLEGLKREYSR